jgi:hypothetical protein
VSVLTLAPEAVRDEVNELESYINDDGFEEFVRNTLFPESHYILLNKTHDDTDDVDEFIESLKEPRFKFRIRHNSREFYVEVKYYSVFRNGAIDWCQPFQLKKYQKIEARTPVYIVIGIGGHPKAPYQISLISLEYLRLPRLYPSFLKEFRVPTGHSITEEELLTISC